MNAKIEFAHFFLVNHSYKNIEGLDLEKTATKSFKFEDTFNVCHLFNDNGVYLKETSRG